MLERAGGSEACCVDEWGGGPRGATTEETAQASGLCYYYPAAFRVPHEVPWSGEHGIMCRLAQVKAVRLYPHLFAPSLCHAHGL